MHSPDLPRRVACLMLLFSLGAGSGCTPTTEYAYPPLPEVAPVARAPSAPPTMTASADGWTIVTEPGWMHVDLPARPRIAFMPDRTHRGTYRHKDLHARTPKVEVMVSYVEYDDARDIAEASAASAPDALIGRWGRQAPGFHVESVAPFALGQAAGHEFRLRLDANSAANHASFAAIDVIRILWVRGRYYKLDCAAPANEWTTCQRVLDSFALDGG